MDQALLQIDILNAKATGFAYAQAETIQNCEYGGVCGPAVGEEWNISQFLRSTQDFQNLVMPVNERGNLALLLSAPK
jgi:hypothetical protein